jgi:hypothetical protein
MSKKLVEIKVALAKKYERMAKVAGSKGKKQTFIHKAETYRRQAERLSRE